jgi:hypothetical protein
VAVKQALEAKMDAIEKLLARNFSTTAIAKLYHKAGIGASAETIRKHIDGLLTQKSASSRSKVKKRVNHKVAASSMPPTETTAQTVASKSGSAFNLDQEPA